jgi:hypothetical protein
MEKFDPSCDPTHARVNISILKFHLDSKAFCEKGHLEKEFEN